MSERAKRLVAEWRSLEWYRKYSTDERATEYICAEELEAALPQIEAEARLDELRHAHPVCPCDETDCLICPRIRALEAQAKGGA